MTGGRNIMLCIVGAVLLTSAYGFLAGNDCKSCITLVETLKVVSPSMFESADSICDSVEDDVGKGLCMDAMKDMKDMTSRQICVVFEQCKADEDSTESEMLGADGQDELVFDSEIANGDVSGVQVQFSFICNICDLAVDFLHRFLSRPNAEKMILRLLKGVCNYIPYVRNYCTALVDEYGPMIINFAKEFIKPGVCHTWLHCPKVEAEMKLKTNCRLCRFWTGVMIDTLRDPLLDARINLYSQDFCARTADDDHLQASECAETAAELSEFLRKLASDLSPPTYMRGTCEDMGVCSADEEQKEVNVDMESEQ